MPLTRTEDIDVDSPDFITGVLFGMKDPEGRRIVCRVTREALEDRAAADKENQRDQAATFARARKAIEAAASRRFDAGEKAPVVHSEDIVPPKPPRIV
ncbi:MAG: DUF1488 family protein [Rhizobiales bacterium]|nr:DUF1488 family protein [Hyphomicrobiales bacterium]